MRQIASVAFVVVASAGCDQRKPPAPAPPATGSGSGSVADLPDPLNLDWQNLHYDLGSLGTVTATAGRAEFRVVEDDSGAVHATQDPAISGVGTGFLDVGPPALVDLDGDHHDESVIPFELHNAHDSVFGAFVFTLRDGLPVQLASIPTTKKVGFWIDGATIKTADGAVWRWDPQAKRVVERR